MRELSPWSPRVSDWCWWMRKRKPIGLERSLALESFHPDPQELRVRENGRKGVLPPQPNPAPEGVDAARELSSATSRLMESLQYRLLRLRTIGDPESKALAVQCEHALADIRAELDAMAAERERRNSGS